MEKEINLPLTQEEAKSLLLHLRRNARSRIQPDWVYELIQKLSCLLDDRQ